ncbi:Putative beta-lactamase-inhibitor-like, PepSY-like [Pustulibacterium marinum]|uniref:Putative beta-lactamase-inhibitor-like, PepSY-like n=1 Tax=Pustulibacterium marinum TaxID=1224947 RepID=A0A1I7HU31_9FLAO|nr:PepSY-like domain-containing protein [Pustulibacterium marinum]SFU64244.1 Putative beta-lactamase-inhibitor-like, PepSY-like [Pustulibacterium marinum]
MNSVRAISIAGIIGVVILSCLFSCESDPEVPSKVENAFVERFPTAEKAHWDKEDATQWEAEFIWEGKEYSANFANDGTWKETEYEIKETNLPESCKKTLSEKFPEYTIEETAVSETIDGGFYEVEIEKGEVSYEVLLAQDGKIQHQKKNVAEGEEDEEEY